MLTLFRDLYTHRETFEKMYNLMGNCGVYLIRFLLKTVLF